MAATKKKAVSPINNYHHVSKEIIIMGIDPGLATLGIGVAKWDGVKITHLYHGVIRTSSELHLERRLSEIRHDIRTLIAEYKPDIVTLEEFFMPRFKKNANGFNTAKAIGAIMTVPGDLGIPVYMYPAPVVKGAACGNTKADKDDVMRGVEEFYNMDKIRPSHAADALGTIMCFVKGRPHLGKDISE